jgi:uncharacterized protein YbjQ (UPF0145 family)
MALPIFTIQSFNQSALQPAGAVFAQRVESVSVAKSSFAGFSSPNTGRSTAMEKKMNDLTKALISEINSQAKATYPNAVALVDLKLQFSNIGKNGDNILLAGQASATALLKRKAPAPIAAPIAAPVVMSQPMAAPVAMPSQPMDMAIAAPVPVASQPMASQPVAMAPPAPEPMAMAPPVAMASQPVAMAPPMPMAPPGPGPAPVPQQGARRNRRRTVNRNKRSSRKNRR